MFCFTDM